MRHALRERTCLQAVGDLPLAVHEVNEIHGVVLLKVSKPRLSYTVRKEIHPLEWAEIFGNIGGCWGEYRLRTALDGELTECLTIG